jgi:hypothetical protein
LRVNTNLYGGTQIGVDCAIGPDATLRDCIVGDNCTIGKGSWEGEVFPNGSTASDRLSNSHGYFGRAACLIPETPLSSFIIMPFREPYLSQYEKVIKPTVEKLGFQCRIGRDQVGAGVVINDLWDDINRAQLIIAEITEPNSNVWYELGLAHALDKPTIMLSKTPDDEYKDLPLSFDIRHHRVLRYSPAMGDLADSLESWLKNAKEMSLPKRSRS